MLKKICYICNSKQINLMKMKKIFTTMMAVLATLSGHAQTEGWPSQYGGVMLQAFYWDSYDASRWTKLEAQADELAGSFDLIWIPQSGNCGGQSMGYDDLYWFPDGKSSYNSSFGTEAQLRSMIKTFKAKGLKTIADVVINHRRNVSNWVDFPKETYNGVTYQLQSTDICANDDGGKAKTEAAKLGLSVSTNIDTGEGWDGMRDLDHKSTNVQNNVKAYLKMLLEDLGYAGFRYDMVKGYSGSYTKQYNEYANPEFSVGECWDGTSTISSWINATGKTSAAFDFQFKYVVRNAANNNNWTRANQQNDNVNWPLISNNFNSGSYKRYAITFVENHDTEVRPDGSSSGPLEKDTLAANAYMLAMPGTPCVFFKHWIAYKKEISAMIAVRKACGIHNESAYEVPQNSKLKMATLVTGKNGKLLAVVGTNAASYTDTGYTTVLKGYHFSYLMDNNMNTAWADLASGKYDGKQEVTLTAVTGTAGAELVYTLDGSNPTASSTKAKSGDKITIGTGETTLKVGLLIGGVVSGVITRQYSISSFEPYTFTVYVNTDKVGWTTCNFWSWGGDGTHAPAKGGWPGDAVSTTTTINGRKWFAHDYKINSTTDEVNFVFSTGSGAPQTVNAEGITKDTYVEVLAEKSGSNHLVSLSNEPPVITQPGDVNGDNVVNLKDVMLITQHLLGKHPTGFDTAAADVNGDGKIDVSDVVKLIALVTRQAQ